MEHFAHVRRSLPAEDRVLGDNGVTEGFAFLLEHLVSDPRWLAAQLDFPRADEYTRFSSFTKLFFILFDIILETPAPDKDFQHRAARPQTFAEITAVGQSARRQGSGH